jgi:hypothetical protein
MFRKPYLLLLITAFFICLSTVTANADVIFSDIPASGPLYDSGSAASSLGSAFSGGITYYSQFAAGGTGIMDVTQIDVAVDGYPSISDGIFQVQIWNSSAALGVGTAIPTGAALYTSGNLTPIGAYSSVHGLVAISLPISGIGSLSLTAGVPYFMSVNVVNSNGNAKWYRNVFPAPPNITTGLEGEFSNGSWIVTGDPTGLRAFDILGSAPPVTAPEPTTMLLLGLGLVGLAGMRRKMH